MLQVIGVWFGLKNPIGGTDLIAYDMHNVSKDIAPNPGVEVAKNLTFSPEGRFQKSAFWVDGASYGQPKSVKSCVDAYNALSS